MPLVGHDRLESRVNKETVLQPVNHARGRGYVKPDTIILAVLRQRTLRNFIEDNLMAMSMMKEAWLESFGGCETLENTPATIAELEKRALAGLPTESHVWSELEKQCEQDEYFAGTRWTEIISGVRRDAARFYLREKPFEGFWMLVPGEIYGACNRNFYRCDECGHRWVDEYPGIPDDDCNVCGSRHWQPWLTEELDGEGNLVATEEHSGANRKHFERGYRDGSESDDLQAKKLAADEMFDACRMAWHELLIASPHLARHFGDAVLEETIQRYDEELDRVLTSQTYWKGVLSGLKDRAAGNDRTRQTTS